MKNLFLYILLILCSACSTEPLPQVKSIDNPYFHTAYDHLDAQQADSAFLYFSLAKDVFMEHGDSTGVAQCLINMGITLTEERDFFSGMEVSLEALAFLKEDREDHRLLYGSNYNNLALAAYHMKDYQRALDFYDRAIQFAEEPAHTYTYLGNKAKVYNDNKQYDVAIQIFESLLQQVTPDSEVHARLLTNLALARLGQDSTYRADIDYLKALRMREVLGDLRGQNSSYTHLSDYHAKSSPHQALFYARKLHHVARQIGNGEDEMLAVRRLLALAPADSAKIYFEVYRHLNDSIQQARSNAKNQFAMIRYEVEKNKADNLRLQQLNAEKTSQINRSRLLTAAVVLFTSVALGFGVLWYKKRKQRLELEAQNRIKAHQLKTSKKIHDVVANGLYRVMAEIEHQAHIDREEILDRLEGMYEQSRDISYETGEPTSLQSNYSETVKSLLTSFASPSCKIVLAGNQPQTWEQVSRHIRDEVYQVLQELMVNMRKHSQAAQVAVRFAVTSGKLQIYYNDNGTGLSDSFKKGNGLTNTGTRIEGVGGHITFAGEAGKGLKIQIDIPLT